MSHAPRKNGRLSPSTTAGYNRRVRAESAASTPEGAQLSTPSVSELFRVCRDLLADVGQTARRCGGCEVRGVVATLVDCDSASHRRENTEHRSPAEWTVEVDRSSRSLRPPTTREDATEPKTSLA